MRRSFVSLTLVASASLVVLGCRGKLLATAHLTAPGSAEVHFRGSSKSFSLWSDYDGTWTGTNRRSRMPLHYDVEVLEGTKSLAKLSCNTESSGGTAVCGSETTFGGEHTGNCEVSLDCSLPTLAPGDVTLKVTGKYADPSRVRRVSNMSLNVREK
jgi:hypothetical protein